MRRRRAAAAVARLRRVSRGQTDRLGFGEVLEAVELPKPVFFGAGDPIRRAEDGASCATRGGALALPLAAPGAGDGHRDALELPNPRGVSPGDDARARRAPAGAGAGEPAARRAPADFARAAAAAEPAAREQPVMGGAQSTIGAASQRRRLRAVEHLSELGWMIGPFGCCLACERAAAVVGRVKTH